VTVWLDGGAGLDALLGEQTRLHEDLDVAIARQECPPAEESLAALGFRHARGVEPRAPRPPGAAHVRDSYDLRGRDTWQRPLAGCFQPRRACRS
jgi:hypothetical protein